MEHEDDADTDPADENRSTVKELVAG
jgi:hypothetical protein